MRLAATTTLIGTVIVVLGLMQPAVAAPAAENPCAGDIEKFCKDAKPGSGRLNKCLKQHEAELSQVCKDARAGAKSKAETFRQACKADVDTLCRGVKPGQGRIYSCLMAKESELSSQCRNQLKQGKAGNR